jgi:hypothetical protein
MKGGGIVQDHWELAGKNVKIALIVLSVVYFLTYPAYIVLVINVNIPDTYTYTPSTWGTYYSCRYISLAWWAVFLSGARIFIPLAVFTMIGIRKVKGCISFHVLIIFVIAILGFLANFGFWVLAGTCNDPGTQCNICDDALKCCEPTAYSKGNCPNTGPCQFSLTQSQLYWDSTFTGLFVTNLLYLIADGFVVLCILIIWYGWCGPSDVETSAEAAAAFQMAAAGPQASAPPMEDDTPVPMDRRIGNAYKRVVGTMVPSLKLE